MNDPVFKTAAFNMAENTPEYLGKPTSPPISWQKEGDNLVVILADGRKIRGPIFDRYRDAVASVKKQLIVPGYPTGTVIPAASLPAVVVVPVPVHEVVTPFPVQEVVTPLPKRDPPAKKKAGKGK